MTGKFSFLSLSSFILFILFHLLKIIPCLDPMNMTGQNEGEAEGAQIEAVNPNLPIRQYLDANIMPQLIEALE